MAIVSRVRKKKNLKAAQLLDEASNICHVAVSIAPLTLTLTIELLSTYYCQ
jgi:hypothetical protein